MSQNKRVLVLENGLKLMSRIPSLFKDADITYIDNISQVYDTKDFDMFVSGLLLSHAENTDACKSYIEKICGLFPISIFLSQAAMKKTI